MTVLPLELLLLVVLLLAVLPVGKDGFPLYALPHLGQSPAPNLPQVRHVQFERATGVLRAAAEGGGGGGGGGRAVRVQEGVQVFVAEEGR